MKSTVVINGFGRIGRMVFRRGIMENQFRIAAINASYPIETLAHLIKYDSTHGKFEMDVQIEGQALIVNGQKIRIVNDRNPLNLPWRKYKVDIVIEATGQFNDRENAMKHIQAGAKKVVLTAPGKDEDITIVMGVNDRHLNIDQHHILSNASCTTNCLAPVIKVLDDAFGVEHGLATTVHAYTNDQKIIDNPHSDLRRARSCAQSIIPTTTGAAKAIGLVLPHLKGKIHGMALRVPTPNVSLVDLVVDLKKTVTSEAVNEAYARAAKGSLQGILSITHEPLVSIDFNSNPHSAIIDGLSTMVLEGRKVKVIAWYDNEWGYSSRVVELVKTLSSLMAEDQVKAV